MSKFIHQHPLVLASGSSIRFKLLASLGLEFSVVPSQCDEEAIKKIHQGNVLDLGFKLATAKALQVSAQHPKAFIIAADQLCVIEDKILDKPLNHQTAVRHLRLLNGKQHQQIACLVIAQNNKILWQYHDIANLTLHHLDEATMEHYLQTEKPYQSCGAYQYETLGKWLFKEVKGKEDTILGLPLLPLTNALINLKVVQLG